MPAGAGGAGGRPRAEVVEVGRLGRGQRARRWMLRLGPPREPHDDSSPVTRLGPGVFADPASRSVKAM